MSNVPVDGPNSWYVPETAAHFQLLGLNVPDFRWPCQEASGSLVNTIGASLPLAANATGHLYRRTIPRWNRWFLGTDGTTIQQSWRTTSDLLDLTAGKSFAMIGLGSIGFNSIGLTQMWMGISTNNEAIAFSDPSSATGGLIRAGVNGAYTNGVVTHTGAASINVVRQFAIWRNNATSSNGARTNLEAVTPAYNSSARSGQVKGLGPLTAGVGSGTPPIGRYGGLDIYLGTNAEFDIAAHLAILRGAQHVYPGVGARDLLRGGSRSVSRSRR